MIRGVATDTTGEPTAARSARRSARARARRAPWRGLWSGRTDVEQVRLYTVGSLRFIAVFLLATGVLAAGARLGETGPALAALGAAVVLGLAVDRGIAPALASGRPMALPQGAPWLVVLLLVTACLAAWGATLPLQTAHSLVLLGCGACGWLAGAYLDRRVVGAVGVLGGAAALVATGNPWTSVFAAGTTLFLGFTVASSLWLMGIVTELDAARGTQAALAVAEERLRFSRDVHDVLGRHLSTIAVQAELAATLVRRGDARAEAKTLEVRASAHDALREARELARGYRPLDLATELEGAVSLLRSAGIEADADLDGLPEAWHEPVARVVREAVTNVLRHSDAGAVRISRTGGVVRVLDDGSPRPDRADGGGSGLSSLREALAPLGARLEARATGSGFEVVAHLGTPRPIREEDDT